MSTEGRSTEVEIFQACFHMEPSAQAAYLADACRGDDGLRERVGALLAAHLRAERARVRPVAVLPLGLESTPETIGPYDLLGVLGEGGMGTVYEAEQRHPVRRRVALKIVKPGMHTAQVVDRFMSERQALAAMEHPYVAKVFDAGQTVSGRPYFVMEIVRGEPLLAYCDRVRLGLRPRIGLFILVCHAVQHAHQKGVIHRDLKPSNVLVTDGENGPAPKVIDFGIAKAIGGHEEERPGITRPGQAPGTPAYMSPEQAGYAGGDANGDIDTRSDIYSLGVVLYELLTGTLPADPTTSGEAEFLVRLSSGELAFPRPSLRAPCDARIEDDLDWIVMKALDPDRDRRYETVASLADDLTRYLQDQPVTAGPPVLSYRARKFIRRHRVQVTAAAVAALALVAGAATAGVGFVRATRAEAHARREATKAQEVSAFLTALFDASDPNVRGSSTLRELLDRGAARIDRLDGQPLVQASLLGTLGHVYGALGAHREAISLAERALVLAAGADTLETAELAMTLGRSKQIMGDFAGARSAFERALAIRTRLLGEHHLDVAVVLNNLGGLYSQLEDNAESIAAHSRALAIQRRVGGPDGMAVTNSLRGLAIVYSRTHELEKALDLDQQVLAIYRKTYGANHALIGSGLHSVAVDLFDLKRLDEARAAADEALAIRRKALGGDHPQLAFTHHLIGEILAASGHPDQAMAAYREALRIRERALGAENPRTGDTICAVARLQARAGRLAAARPLFERAVRIYEKAYGTSHSKTAGAKGELASIVSRSSTSGIRVQIEEP